MSDKLIVLGDSHSLAVIPALQKMRPDLQILGGQLRLEPRKANDFSHVDELGRLRVHPDIQEPLNQYLEPGGLSGEDLLQIVDPMLFSLSGVAYFAMLPEWSTQLPFPSPDRHFMSRELFETHLRARYHPFFNFFGQLTKAGKQIAGLVSPGVRNNDDRRGELFQLIRAFYTTEMRQLGAGIVDVTEATCDANGVLDRDYWADNPEDFVHANQNWGRLVATSCLQEFGL